MRRRWLNLDSPVFGNIFTMDLLRRKEASTGRLLVLAVVFGWCLGSVSCFGQSLDSEFTFLLPAGRSECFFQTAVKNGTMEVEYQVIAGAGMDVDFTILSPEGDRLIVESRRSDGVHVVEPTHEGDYQICFDNSFSRFSEKMVFFEIIIEGQGGDVGGDDEWAGLEEPDGSLLEYKLEDIRESMESLHRRLERSRQVQTVLRAFEARDRNLLEDNLWKVSFWSCASVLVMLCVAFTQVYTVRKLFDDRRRVCT
ncbi:Transmembrane emp24 domain-containing protein 1 p24 family protein gamma-1 [Collichthys lucidus]|uniref:Transmembrane emp24 domain-containing protein 1 p24 family protein gamma-1 n=1 Tax=Collichthys lucidus TaxID=240159 RepID=A0A4U5U489_COLLU|nr:Transmembrane emp24 domain-containing protein 1 p24 family protein gamma-1 [Collichthys lucidus]